MVNPLWINRYVALAVASLGVALVSVQAAIAAAEPEFKVAGGMAVYLGVVPADIVKGHAVGHPEQAMHGGPPKGPHQHHVVLAIFDTTTGARISDATVTAQVSGLGLSGSKLKLEPMEINNTLTYGQFVNLPGRDLYTVRLTVERTGSGRPVVFDFKYDHRR